MYFCLVCSRLFTKNLIPNIKHEGLKPEIVCQKHLFRHNRLICRSTSSKSQPLSALKGTVCSNTSERVQMGPAYHRNVHESKSCFLKNAKKLLAEALVKIFL